MKFTATIFAELDDVSVDAFDHASLDELEAALEDSVAGYLIEQGCSFAIEATVKVEV